MKQTQNMFFSAALTDSPANSLEEMPNRSYQSSELSDVQIL